jgi:hypothetical protein
MPYPYPAEVSGIACIQREIVRDRGGSDHRVEEAHRRLAARAAQRCGNATERPGGSSVEG